MSLLGALQRTLAAQHAAVHVYAVLGGQTSQSEHPAQFALVSERYAVHRGRRDDLVAEVRALGAVPTPAAAVYDLPDALGSSEGIRAAGLELEVRAAGVYAAMVGETSGPLRRWAVEALVDAATSQLEWGGAPGSFPGAPEL